MTFAPKYLEIVRCRGQSQKKLKKVYRNITRNRELFLMAYANLYANNGATTPGTDPEDTVDGMSVERVDKIIEELKAGSFKWKPVRRTYIEKANSKKLRPLGIPSWNDKLVQEVIRLILEAYYEPQFRECSHGFRPGRGCHTALNEIYHTWAGTKWFIETDIKGCFDNIDHGVLLDILNRQIEDERFLKLMRGMLQAGYVDNWRYYRTYSGTPQGGIVSPLLANIVLNELDKYVEDILIPKHTKGSKRKRNPEYESVRQKAIRAKKKGDRETYRDMKTLQRTLPVSASHDPNYTRLRYVRYADDSLLSFIGKKMEAEEIKEELSNFLKGLKLELSKEKTLITHAREGEARFLNYHISIMWNNDAIKETENGKMRGKNGQVILQVPEDVRQNWIVRMTTHNTVRHHTELMNNSDYDIIVWYESRIHGLINYYQMAHNVYQEMSKIRDVYEESLIKTLACKHRMNRSTVKRKYTLYTADGKKVIGVKTAREGKDPLIASYGKKPIRQNRNVILTDNTPTRRIQRTEILQRLLHDECELCGKAGNVSGHHIRKLKDLKAKERRRKGQIEPWEHIMIAMNRKTLFVCKECHNRIHAGRYDGAKLA